MATFKTGIATGAAMLFCLLLACCGVSGPATCDNLYNKCPSGQLCLGATDIGKKTDYRGLPIASGHLTCYSACNFSGGPGGCEGMQACIKGLCVFFDTDCSPGKPECPAGFVCNHSAGDVCIKSQGGECNDNLQGQFETDIDCGGTSSCPRCGALAKCQNASDCQSGVCTDQKCQAESCSDGVKNGAETDIDCAGACSPCAANKACAKAADCASLHCDGTPLVCVAASCSDGIRNAQEGDIDCGGPCPQKCKVNNTCNVGVGADCESGVCDATGHCAAPTCNDLVHNGTEADVDCGAACGSAALCATDQMCLMAADCQNGVCADATPPASGKHCLAPACDDGVKNGNETDEGCGGGTCPKCGDNKVCAVAADCASGVCEALLCRPASCVDAIKNGQETDLNCGGPDCAPCVAGGDCAQHADCQTQICTSDVTVTCPGGTPCCQMPACSDNVQSPGETDKDCGGPVCARCEVGQSCLYSRDCGSGVCSGGHCKASRLALGGTQSCAVSTAGAVRCWGGLSPTMTCELGQPDQPTITPTPGGTPPPAVPLGANVTAMQAVAGFNFTCALTHEGTIRCWGANDTGQLGVGSVDGLCWDASTIPAPTNVVSFANDTVHIEAGFSHSCAMSETGGVACWGANTAGQLGIGNTNHIGDGVGELPAASVALNDTTRTVQIATGGAHSCALSGTGRVRCWGLGTKGQLGYGNTNNIGTKPGEVPPPAIDLGHATVVTQLAVGFAHTCALTTAHTVKCWGDGAAGQLGYGNTQAVGDAPGEMPPPDVDLGDSVTPVQIAAGNDSTCILTDAGAIKCWGFGTVTNIPVPTGVVIGDDETPANGGWIVLGQSVTASAIALGEFHGCALVGVDAVKCWGGRFVFSVTGGALVDVNGTQTPDLVAPIILE